MEDGFCGCALVAGIDAGGRAGLLLFIWGLESTGCV